MVYQAIRGWEYTAKYYTELINLVGDDGAKSILRHPILFIS